MADLRASIERVTLIERQITPLMIRMIDALGEFVERDLPFDREERIERVERLREIMDQADVAPSEKLRLVFEAYQIENGFGRTIEATEGVLPLGGAERQVSILRIGRVVLAYQTIDGSEQGVWNPQTNSWEELGSEFATAIRNGIRVASQQASPQILNLPVHGPEDIQ